MFARKAIVALLAFGVFANALPHGRRGTCRPHASISVSSAVAAPTGNVNAGGNPPPVVKDNTGSSAATPTKSVKGDSTSAPTPPKTSSKPSPSNAPSSGNAQFKDLFPVAPILKSWSTAPQVPNHLPLSDATLHPTRDMRQLSHDVVSAPDGKQGIKAHYPKGSYALHTTDQGNPIGGFSFYALGPIDLTGAKEVTLGYSVFFPEGFDFQLGGKLPGLYGGNSDDEAVNCSGGSRKTSCFSARLMWRQNGLGEFYTYLPPYTIPQFSANKKQCDAVPGSDCNPTYGASIGRGAFSFARGKWNTVSKRVRLNTVGKADGELQLFVNGKSVINLSGLILRDSGAGKLRGIQMQTFFGGSKLQFASPKAQDAYFADFSVAITENL